MVGLSNQDGKKISIKALMIMPSLLLQKPSFNSKAKDNVDALKRRLEHWKRGDIDNLLIEGKTIQSRLLSLPSQKSEKNTPRRFAQFMEEGKVNNAMRLLQKSNNRGILPLTEETFEVLLEKHPPASKADEEVLLKDEINDIHPVIYECIDSEYVKEAAKRTKGAAGPSGLDADGWRRILLSANFGNTSEDLRKAIAQMTRRLCTDKNAQNISAFLASRLIPLDKNPGVRPIGVGEVLRRIIGKIVMKVVKKDVITSTGSLQLCAGQDAGCEAAIHSSYDLFHQDETEAVLMVDASNAFNSINREAFLHNIKVICPAISTYVFNCYSSPSDLFIHGGRSIKSLEGTTQGDPTAMAIYALGITPLMALMCQFTRTNKNKMCKQVAFADDLNGIGDLQSLRDWWNLLTLEGPKYGYNVNPTKSHLIVKLEHFEKATQIFSGTNIIVTKEGHRHLGSVIGDQDFTESYKKELVKEWCSQLQNLSDIAKTEPHAAYSAFVTGFRNKLTYHFRTVKNLKHHLQPLEDIISNNFIPSLFENFAVSEDLRKLLSLPIKLGGMSIINPLNVCDEEYRNSRELTSQLAELVIEQEPRYKVDEERIKECKKNIKMRRNINYLEELKKLKEKMTPSDLRLNDIAQEQGASSWLSVIPLKRHGFHLSKREFWDAVKLRYGLQLNRLPSHCGCSANFDIQHALSCKKGGFITLRHNELRDNVAEMLQEVCTDVQIEPVLQQITGEEDMLNGANLSNEARSDISARGFWIRGQRAFFDIRVFDPKAQRYGSKSLKHCYEINEKEKKRQYNQRIINVDQGSFTPLVFSVNGGMGREASMFVKKLSKRVANKRKEEISVVTHMIRSKLSFALLKSCLLCIRGSRRLKNEYERIANINFEGIFAETIF